MRPVIPAILLFISISSLRWPRVTAVAVQNSRKHNGVTEEPMKDLFSFRFMVFHLSFVAGFLYSMPASAVDWTITDLGTLGGTQSVPNSINARGHVVGGSYTADDNAYHAFFHDGMTIRDLHTLGGSWSDAYDINVRGQVVGSSYLSGDNASHAFLHDGTDIRDLGTLGGTDSAAIGINDSGLVVGWSFLSGDLGYHPILFDGAMHDLGTLGAGGGGSAVNARGQVVGWYFGTYGGGYVYQHAFLYDGATIRDLGTLGGSNSVPSSINATGQVVGWSNTSDSLLHPFLYDGTAMHDLGMPSEEGGASDINNRRQVVGWRSGYGAFLYDGAMRDISALPEVIAAGWQSLTFASAINDSGQIVGGGEIGGQTRAFRLHPQTTSRYMTTVDSVTLFNLGCAQTYQSGLLILDFGSPRYNGTDYGTSLFQGFAAISSIESAVRYFLNGYYVCGGGGFMTVAVGTTSHGSQVTSEHGAAWGEMMTRLNNYISNYRDRLAVVGAIDIEPGGVPNTGWSSPTVTRAWVDGYSSTSPVRYYNYGSADGCQTTGTSPCNNGWTPEDLWYVSWGSPANPLPVPEIYYNAPPLQPVNALQWINLATLHGGAPMNVPGVLSEWQACNDDPDQTCSAGYNTPLQAWQQMMDALHTVSPDPTAVQSILYSSDITWQN